LTRCTKTPQKNKIEREEKTRFISVAQLLYSSQKKKIHQNVHANNKRETKQSNTRSDEGVAYRSFFDSLEDELELELELELLLVLMGHEAPSPRSRPLNGHFDPLVPHDWRQHEYQQPTARAPHMKSNSLQHIKILTNSANARTFQSVPHPPPPHMDDRLHRYSLHCEHDSHAQQSVSQLASAAAGGDDADDLVSEEAADLLSDGLSDASVTRSMADADAGAPLESSFSIQT